MNSKGLPEGEKDTKGQNPVWVMCKKQNSEIWINIIVFRSLTLFLALSESLPRSPGQLFPESVSGIEDISPGHWAQGTCLLQSSLCRNDYSVNSFQ